ncbi:MAG: DUF4032 domain-containing protein [Candidatus Dormibacteraeota bacterium]|nr:DUF4032 domain-containing protein [Candidatus Dormibacteraeota bacterium]
MIPPYTLTLRPGHEELVGLDWARPLARWTSEFLVDRPAGLHRHEVRFVALHNVTYALKELPVTPARRDYEVLRLLEERNAPAVRPVGLAVRGGTDPTTEGAAVLITRFADRSVPYRHVMSGGEVEGALRPALLDAVAGLLVELHLYGCFWGDCSLSNVLYRHDGATLETILVDAETATIRPFLSDGGRREDIEIMIENVGAEMADLAASVGKSLDAADLTLGHEIADRYEGLWQEVAGAESIPYDQRYRIADRVRRLNALGFEVDEIELNPHPSRHHVHLRVRVGDRNWHANRLRELTGIEASENQARHLLADLQYWEMLLGPALPGDRALRAARWRMEVYEPHLSALLTRLRPGSDLVQAYCDVLTHRYYMSVVAGRDVGTEVAIEDWLKSVDSAGGETFEPEPKPQVAD